jgi:hypothetical protein
VVTVSAVGEGEVGPVPAFRDVLNEARTEQALGLLEGSQCPEPVGEPWADEFDAIILDIEGEAVVYQTDSETAWVQSDRYVDLEAAR